MKKTENSKIKVTGFIDNDSEIYKIDLSNKIYAPDVDSFKKCIDEALNHNAKHIILHCPLLEQLDSVILSSIITSLKIVTSHKKGRIVFTGLNNHIRRILNLTNMEKYFPVFNDIDDAAAYLKNLK